MNRYFNTCIASAYGIDAAILFEDIRVEALRSEAAGSNFHDGRYWMKRSVKSFAEEHPYLTSRAIRRALDSLEHAGLIVTGCFNRHPCDHTKWYSLTEKGNTSAAA